MAENARSLLFRLLVTTTLIMLTACGGGGSSATTGSGSSPIGNPPTSAPPPGGTPTSAPPPGGTPTSAPPPGVAQVVVSSAALSFTAAGPGVPGQAVIVSQAQNTTGFSLSTTTCATVASVTPTTGAGSFTFTPLAGGTCAYLVTGKGGATAAIGITVTTTSIISH